MFEQRVTVTNRLKNLFVYTLRRWRLVSKVIGWGNACNPGKYHGW